MILMKTSNVYFLTITVLLLISSINCNSQLLFKADNDTSRYENKIKIMIGKKAQEWILKEGNFNSLSDFKKNLVLLEFSAIGCPGCKILEKDLNDINFL